MGIFGIAKRGFGKALKAHKSRQRAKRIAKGERGPTITGVKPMSGKIPHYIGAGGKDPEKRRRIVRTHLSLERSDKIEKLEKKVKEGKEGLKKMVDTGQATEYKNLPGQHKKKGFED